MSVARSTTRPGGTGRDSARPSNRRKRRPIATLTQVNDSAREMTRVAEPSRAESIENVQPGGERRRPRKPSKSMEKLDDCQAYHLRTCLGRAHSACACGPR